MAQGERPEAVKVEAPALSQRATDERRARRRRDDGDLDRMGRMALAIPPEVRERLEREGKTFRWVRDATGRQAAMHADDWDVTPGVEGVPESRDGEGKLVLMEKYRDWYEDDQRKKAGALDATEEAVKRGRPTGPDGSAEGGDKYYTLESNSFSTKRGL
jgi:hypothetical protein